MSFSRCNHARRHLPTTAALLILAAGGSLPLAADEVDFSLQPKDDGFACSAKPLQAQAGTHKLVVVVQNATAGTVFSIHAKFKNSQQKTGTVDLATSDQEKTFTATIDPAELAAGTKLDSVDVFGQATVPGKANPVAFSCASSTASNPPAETNPPPADAAKDAAALKFFSEKGSDAIDAFRTTFAKEYPRTQPIQFLVHLPSGAAASPFPESVSEDTYMQVLVLVPAGSAPYTLHLTTCQKRVDFRINGDAQQFQSALSFAKQGAPKGGQPFDLLPAGTPFRCGADEVVYHPQPAGAAPVDDTHLRVRPIFQLATTFVYVFDFARQVTYSVQSNKVAAVRDKYGPGLMVGFTWYPLGLDLEDIRSYNRYFNPVLAFDPKAPTENLILGDAFTWRGGLSLVLGASFHKLTVLKGVAVGDTIASPGDVPTTKQWTRASVGFFAGVALDSNAFATLKTFLKQ